MLNQSKKSRLFMLLLIYGSMYTLQTSNQNNTLQTLVFGSMKGGKPTQFAYTSRGSVDIVGWTTWR